MLTPSIAGFIKGLLMVIVLATVSYLADAAHLTGVLNPVIATFAAALFSAIESSMKAGSDGNKALFGAVSVRK